MSDAWTAFYWRDYIADTGHLSLEQHGAYLLLMAHYYMTGQPLPANASVLHRVCRCTTDADRTAAEQVIREFFVLDGEVYRHNRIDLELAKRADISTKRRRAANEKHERDRVKSRANAGANAVHLHPQPQPQTSKTLPNPPFQGGNGNSRALTSRETKRLNERIDALQRQHLDQFGRQKYDDSGKPIQVINFEEALTQACQIEMLPLPSARLAAIEAGLGEALQKAASA